MDRPFVLLRDDSAGRERLFEHPAEIISTARPEGLSDALAAAEEAHRSGRWLAGYLAYEAGYCFEPKLAPLMPEKRRVPLIALGVFDPPADRPAAPVGEDRAPALTDARPLWTLRDYASRFRKLHRHIRLGDCYQANLTFPVTARWSGDPRAIFDALVARQPVKYGALVHLGGPCILSRSPELFFEIGRDGWIETHPMKGTVPRGASAQEDAANRHFLETDPKMQAENRMIVDLLRNDISRISEVGTLSVPELFRVETYPSVHTMVSRVRARLLPGSGLGDIFAALFPCGSVTGAPKISAMTILNRLESGPREAYCGAIGFVAPDGTMRFNVAIRTVSLYEGGEAVFNVGGGIVFDSNVEAEYAECLLKTRFATDDLAD